MSGPFSPTGRRTSFGVRTEVVVALDWTSFAADEQETIVLSMLTGHGRATPLLWKTAPGGVRGVWWGLG